MYVDIAVVVAVTFVFVFAFVAWARGRTVLALCIVVLLTVMLPIAVLLFIGSPTYASWAETIQVIWRASRENSSLVGFEWGIQQLLVDDIVLINNRGQIVTAGFDFRIAPWRGLYLLTPKR